jgi:hypothetical protein
VLSVSLSSGSGSTRHFDPSRALILIASRRRSRRVEPEVHPLGVGEVLIELLGAARQCARAGDRHDADGLGARVPGGTQVLAQDEPVEPPLR